VYIEEYLYLCIKEAIRKTIKKLEITKLNCDIINKKVSKEINDLKIKEQIVNKHIRINRLRNFI
jgi:hypothetical protein